jgi:hypothetical protein
MLEWFAAAKYQYRYGAVLAAFLSGATPADAATHH